jgi:hypothetical protein
MNPLFERFRKEQLDADIDIGLMEWSEQDKALKIAGKIGGIRLVIPRRIATKSPRFFNP